MLETRGATPVLPTLGFAVLCLAALGSPTHVRSETIAVSTTVDEVTENGSCSLREAILSANSDTAVGGCLAGSGPDTILLPAGEYLLSLVGSPEDAGATGDLDITTDVVLVGTGADQSTIDATGVGERVLHVECAAPVPPNPPIDITVGLHNLRFVGGFADDLAVGRVGGGVLISGCGEPVGGIGLTHATVEDCVFEGNTAHVGGGLREQSDGDVVIRRSRFEGNTASRTGAGFGTCCRGTTLVEDVIVRGNYLASTNPFTSGGAVMINGPTTIRRSTISGNTSDTNGGGIACQYAPAWIENSTISGNTAVGLGGGLLLGLNGGANSCDIVVLSSTIVGNRASRAGGIDIDAGTLTLTNTIVASNELSTGEPRDLFRDFAAGEIVSLGSNLVGNADALFTTFHPDDLLGTAQSPLDPMLGALRDNGGSTPTHLPRIGSPALDSGESALSEDQRGFPRPTNLVDDRGAVERSVPPATCGLGPELALAIWLLHRSRTRKGASLGLT